MYCPECNTNASMVIDSRWVASTKTTRRRMECNNCGFRFTSREVVTEAHTQKNKLFSYEEVQLMLKDQAHKILDEFKGMMELFKGGKHE